MKFWETINIKVDQEVKEVPHALRRGFAKSLLDKKANVAMISKALGHSDISVTKQF